MANEYTIQPGDKIVVDQWDADFTLKSTPDSGDTILGSDSATGNPCKFKMSDLQANSATNILGVAHPTDSPTGTEVNGQGYDVSNTSGADQVFTNFLDSNGDPITVPDGKSGVIRKSGGSWEFVENAVDTSSLVPKSDITNNPDEADTDLVLGSGLLPILATRKYADDTAKNMAIEIFENGGIANNLQDGNDIVTYPNLGTDPIESTYTQTETESGLQMNRAATSAVDYVYMKLGIDFDKLLKINFSITTVYSSNPGFGFGWNFADPTGIFYRNSGLISYSHLGNLGDTIKAASSQFAYANGDNIYFEFKKEPGSFSFRCGKNNETPTDWFPIELPTGEVLFHSRGYGNVTFNVTEGGRSAANEYTDGRVNPLQDQVDSISAEIDPIVYGGPVDRLTEINDYVKTSLNSDYSSATPNQSLTPDSKNGLRASAIASSAGQLNFLKLTNQWSGKMKLLATIESIGSNNPAFGLGFGTPDPTPDGIFKGALLRNNGSNFGLTMDSGSNSLSGFIGAVSPSSAVYSVGDQVAMIFDNENQKFDVEINGVLQLNRMYSELVAPNGYVYLILRDSITLSNIKLVEVTTQIDSVSSVYYVSPDGVENAKGTKLDPFNSIKKAFSMVAGMPKSKIILADGIYRETWDYSSLLGYESVDISAGQTDFVRFFGSDQFSGFSKAAGYSNLYQVSFTGTIPSWTHASSPIFEYGSLSSEITEEQRHPVQRGQTHRLPYTMIESIPAQSDLQATLNALDSAPGKYYYDTVNHLIYVHASDSSNVITNGFQYEHSVRRNNTVLSGNIRTNMSSLTLRNIHFFFGTGGFNSAGLYRLETNGCSVYGANGDYGWQDNATIVIHYDMIAGGNANDGSQSHMDTVYSNLNSLNILIRNNWVKYFNCWWFLNKDDGNSHHQGGWYEIYGGLSEQNYDSGSRPSNGCKAFYYNFCAQDNGKDPDPVGSLIGGEAIGLVNPTLDGRGGTEAVAYNCVSLRNRKGYSTAGDANNRLKLYNCLTRDSVLFEVVADDGGVIECYDVKAYNTDPAKIKAERTGGAINVINTELLPVD